MSAATPEGKGKRRGVNCPICGKPTADAHRPFCSDRCRKVDLNRWFGEAYRVPAAEPQERGENQSESED